MQGTPHQFWGQEVPLDMLLTLVFLDFHGVQMVKNPPAVWEAWVRSLDWDHPEKDRATYSSTPAWRIPGQRSLAG